MKNSSSDRSLRVDSPDALDHRAYIELRRALIEQQKFVKVHVAEALLSLGDGAEVLPVFEEELRLFETHLLHRIGIWRVLARAAPTEAARSRYIGLLCGAYLDERGPDSGAAAESLAKLEYTIAPIDRPKFERAAQKLPANGLAFARWLLALSGNEDDFAKLVNLLDAREPFVRGIAAYSLRHLRDRLSHKIIDQIATIAQREQEGPSRCYLISAAYVTGADSRQISHFIELLLHYLTAGSKDQKYEAASALAIRGTDRVLPFLSTVLDDSEPDVRVAAANAILHVGHRSNIEKQRQGWIERPAEHFQSGVKIVRQR
ncbi:MAG: HEAT repeat domain-containing protein [Pirellulales bacterium]|nr:HEAT repeat domain-containing protein [Pirellulales bacterium]